MENLRAILYTRVSSEQQIENTSLKEQERIGKDFCDKHGYKLLKVFEEKGESAKFIDRTMLQEALSFCANKKNQISLFVVYKYDRFSRSAENHHYIKALLSKYNVQVVSITEPVDDSPSGRLMENVLASFAQFDNEVRTQRSIGGIKARLNSGFWIWKPPLGYIRDETSKEKGLKPLVFDPKIAPFIMQAWQMLLSGNYRSKEIQEWLNKQGVKVIKQQMSKIFNNGFYAGMINIQSMDIKAKGTHPAMITEEEFYKAQALLGNYANTKRVSHLQANPNFPLNKLLRCSSCNRLMSGSFSKGKNNYYPYYNCTYGKCESKNRFKKDFIEGKFQDFLTHLKPEDGLLELYEEIVIDVYKKKLEAKEKLVEPIHNKRSEIEAKLARLDELVEDGTYSKEKYKERKNALEIELASIQCVQTDNNISLYDLQTCLNRALNFLKHFDETWKMLTGEEKIKLYNLIFPKGITYSNGETRTPELFFIYEDLERIKESSDNDNTGGGTRTLTPLRATDFKSVVSTIPPPRHLNNLL